MVYPADRSSDRADLLGKLDDEYPERQYHFGIPDRDHHDHHDLGIYEGREEVFGGEGKNKIESMAFSQKRESMKTHSHDSFHRLILKYQRLIETFFACFDTANISLYASFFQFGHSLIV